MSRPARPAPAVDPVDTAPEPRRTVGMIGRLGAPLLLAILGLGILLTEVVHALIDTKPAPEYLVEVFADYMRGEASIIILAVVVAPIVEEALFRGLLLGHLLSRMRPVGAIVLSAGIFAAAHMNLYQLLPAFCMGLLFGWIYARTRSLPLCILGHAAWNAQWWVAETLLGGPIRGYGVMPEPYAFPRQPLWWLGVGAVALAVALRILASRLEQRAGTEAEAA